MYFVLQSRRLSKLVVRLSNENYMCKQMFLCQVPEGFGKVPPSSCGAVCSGNSHLTSYFMNKHCLKNHVVNVEEAQLMSKKKKTKRYLVPHCNTSVHNFVCGFLTTVVVQRGFPGKYMYSVLTAALLLDRTLLKLYYEQRSNVCW